MGDERMPTPSVTVRLAALEALTAEAKLQARELLRLVAADNDPEADDVIGELADMVRHLDYALSDAKQARKYWPTSQGGDFEPVVLHG